MTISYSNVDVSSDNFGVLFQRINQLLTSLDTSILTVDSNTAIGNSSISGSFTSDAIYTDTISGGVFGNTSNLAINTNTAITGSLTVNGDDVLTGSSTEFLSANSNTTQSAILTVNSISFGGTYLKDVGNNITYNGDIIWTANNDGNGSGLDADLLGGFNSNTYLRTGTNISVANVTISGSLSANGSIGANGAVLYSNGTVSYWDILSVQGGAGYYKGNDGAIGDANNVNNIFRINTNELNANVTFANNENASATGPIVLGASVTMTIETGARVVIL